MSVFAFSVTSVDDFMEEGGGEGGEEKEVVILLDSTEVLFGCVSVLEGASKD